MNSYETPELNVYGSIEDMTLVNGPVPPKDVPGGINPSAYPS